MTRKNDQPKPKPKSKPKTKPQKEEDIEILIEIDDGETDNFTNDEFEEYTWDVIKEYFRSNHLIKHQIDSYNDFIMVKMSQIIEGFNTIDIPLRYNVQRDMFEYNVFLDFHNPVLAKPIICEKDGSSTLMTPHIARLRNLTYASNLYIDVHMRVTWYDEGILRSGSKVIRHVSLGKIPIMLHSNYCILHNNPSAIASQEECMHDQGGYFIVNGNEKVIISQDRIAENKIYVFLDTKQTAPTYVAEIRSVSSETFGTPKLTNLTISNKASQFGRAIQANVHQIRQEVPLFILFRALGVVSDRDIVEYIIHDLTDEENVELIQELKGSVEEANHIMTQADALDWMQKYLNVSSLPKELQNIKEHRIKATRDVLAQDFLPHVGANFHKKALFLGYMAKRLLLAFKNRQPLDDRDSYTNKRVDTPGVLLANLMRQYYGKMIKDMKFMIKKEFRTGSWRAKNNFLDIIVKRNIDKLIRASTIENGLKYGLSTGNWGLKNANVKQGVAQVLNRMTYNSTLSHLRRINTPLEKQGKLIQPRKLHNTQWGVVCPAETPEGQSVGVVKNLSVGATVTIMSMSELIRDALARIGLEFFVTGNQEQYTVMSSLAGFAKYTKVFLNGELLGFHKEPLKMVHVLRLMKRNGIIHIFTGICWDIIRSTVFITTEAGRCVRPLYIVDEESNIRLTKEHIAALKNQELKFINLVSPSVTMHKKKFRADMNSLENLPDTSVIEYVDVEEVNLLMIAMTYSDLAKNKTRSMRGRYTHLEIHPSLILGAVASNIPFSDHNQSPRNCYQSAMGKQAIGVYCTNFRERFDTMAHVLNYPQRPLISTRISHILSSNDLPSGQNVIVAIACFTGFNQEDSIMMNKSAVKRGMFSSTIYRTYKDFCAKKPSTGEEEVFCQPLEHDARGMKPSSYAKLDATGFVAENEYVDGDDIIMGKCMLTKRMDVFEYKDNSMVMKKGEEGYMDRCGANNKYFRNINADGYKFAKVRTRDFTMPCYGDKNSSRHGQKGIIGIQYNAEDMPFTKEGLVPDIIINPHAIPSRMTIAQLLECIMGKACVKLGCFGNGTPFTELSMEDLAEVLEAQGMDPYGDEIMYNPRTGEQLPTKVFMGATHYQRLKHTVAGKIHSRSRSGSMVLLTRQPSEGRLRGGGLRLGGMETDVMCAYGMMSFLKERFNECSDHYRIFVCGKCGAHSSKVNPEAEIFECETCGENTTDFRQLRTPFTFKLLMQEIASMGVSVRYLTE